MTSVETEHGCEVCLDEWLQAIGIFDQQPPEVQAELKEFFINNPLFQEIPSEFFFDGEIVNTLLLAQELHQEHVRKATGHPYVKHVLQVVLTLGTLYQRSQESQLQRATDQQPIPGMDAIEEYLAQTYGNDFSGYSEVIEEVFRGHALYKEWQDAKPLSEPEVQAGTLNTTICGGACHDILEMRMDISKSMLYRAIRDRVPGNDNLARDVATLSQLMVPPDKPKGIPPREYLIFKLSDLVHVLVPPRANTEYTMHLRNIKAADLFAQILETIDDVKRGRDGKEIDSHLFSGNYETRVTMFCLREAVFTALDPDNPFLPAIREELATLRALT